MNWISYITKNPSILGFLVTSIYGFIQIFISLINSYLRISYFVQNEYIMYEGCKSQNMMQLGKCQHAYETVQKGLTGLIWQEMADFSLLSYITSTIIDNPTYWVPLIFFVYCIATKLYGWVSKIENILQRKMRVKAYNDERRYSFSKNSFPLSYVDENHEY